MKTGIAGKISASAGGSALGYGGAIAALLAAILCIVPWHPSFPLNTLDASWQLGVNQAVAQQLRFGTDIVFTLGPYASILTHQFHPATAPLMYGGTALVAAAFCAGIARLTTRRHLLWLWLLPALLGVAWTANAFYQVLPLLPVFILARTRLDAGSEYRIELNAATIASVLLLAAALGIVSISKANFLAPAGAGCLLSLSLLSRRQAALAPAIAAAFLATMVLGWHLSGQRLVDLPRYFLSLPPLIAGHTDAMSLAGPVSDVGAFLVALVLLALLWCRRSCFAGHWRLQSRILAAWLLTAFFVFKSAFVRHDVIHAAIAAEALLLIAFIAGFQLHRGGRALSLLIALLCWCAIEFTHARGFTAGAIERTQNFYAKQIEGAAQFAADPDWAAREYQRALAAIRRKNPLAVRGSADIYSYNQAVLLANNLRWQPRPVFQSYLAYLPQLAALNAAHLGGAAAAENIIFRLQAIDRRYPALDDGRSWPALLEYYSPQAMLGDRLILNMRSAAARPVLDREWIATQRHAFGASVELPQAPGRGLWVELDSRPTLIGRLLSTVYKLPALTLTIQRRDGVSESFRFIAGSGRAGFLLSPYIGDSADFARLYEPRAFSAMAAQSVVRIEISGGAGSALCWEKTYQLKVKYFNP